MSTHEPNDLSSFLDNPAKWQRVSGALRRVARGILGDEAAAEDVVQGAWLEALKRPQQSVGFGWIRKLVKSRSIDQLRSRRSEQLRNAASPQGQPSRTHDDVGPKLEAQRQVIQAVDSLKEPYRSTIYLRYFEDLGPKAIAKRQGVPEETVKTRLTRAHRSLRESLGREMQDERGNWSPALIAFSGIQLPAPGAAIAATSGLFLMKKIILALLVLGLIALTPLLFHKKDLENTGLQQESAKVLETESAPIQASGVDKERGRLPIDEPAVQEVATSIEVLQAFPLKPIAEASALDLTLRWPDGAPAQGVEVTVLPWGSENPHLHKQIGFSNSLGAVSFEQLSPGKMGIYLDRGGFESCTVGAGQRLSLQIQMKAGYTLSGKVLDPRDRPVPGAVVHVSYSQDGRQGNEWSQADATGRYEILHITGHARVSARAPGFAPSGQYPVHGAPGTEGELDLILRGPGGALSGIVFSPDGLPVEGALVQFTDRAPPGWGSPQTISTVQSHPLAIRLRSDAQGEFFAPDVGSGSVHVAVRTKPWVGWSQTVTVAQGATSHLTVQLENGTYLEGTILRANGEPAAHAEVLMGTYGTILELRAKCSAEGHYRLENVEAGEHNVLASLDGVGSTHETIQIQKGSPYRWDATLAEGSQVQGTLLDENGDPLSNWIVGCMAGQGMWSNTARTTVDGRFVLSNIGKFYSDLSIAPPNGYSTGVCWIERNVLPTASDLTIVVPGRALPTASLSLRVLIGNQPAGSTTSILLKGVSDYASLESTPNARGLVGFSDIRPISYDLDVKAPGYPVVRRRISIDAGQAMDLGTITIQKGGKVEVNLLGALAKSASQAHVVDDAERVLSSFDLRKGKGVSGLLNPGPVRIRISGQKNACMWLEGTVQAGSSTPLSGTPRPGTFRQFAVSRKDEAPLAEGTSAQVRKADGQIIYVDEDITSRDFARDRVLVKAPGLEIGGYVITIESPGEERLEHAFQVRNLEKPGGKGEPLLLGE